MRQAARVRLRAQLEGRHQRAEMGLREARLAPGQRLETLQRGRRLAALEKAHAGEQIHFALPIGRQRQHLEGARRGIEHLVGKGVAAGTGHLEHQAVGAAREEGPAAAHRRGIGTAGEAPGGSRRLAGRLIARQVLRRDVLPRLGVVLVVALGGSREPLPRRLAAARRLRILRQREGAHLHLHARTGDVRRALARDLPAFVRGGQDVLHAVQRVVHLDGSLGLLRQRPGARAARGATRGQRRGGEPDPHWRCSRRGCPTSRPPMEW